MTFPTAEDLAQEFRAEQNEQLPFDFEAEYEQDLAEMEEAAPGTVRALGRGAVRGLENVAAGVGAIYDWMGDITGIEAMQVGGEDAYNYWQRAAREGTFAPDPYIYRGTFMQNPGFKRAMGIVSEALPSYGTALTVSVATGNPWAGAAMLGLLEGAPQYEEAREEGLGLAGASYYGLLSTMGTAMLEYLPISRLLGRAGTGFTRNILQSGAEEGLQEVSQTLWQNYLAKVGYDDTRDMAQGIVESFIGGAGSGGIAGGTTSKLNGLAERAKAKGVTDEEITELYNNLQKQVEAAASDIENWSDKQGESIRREYEDEQLAEEPGGEILTSLKRGRLSLEDARAEVDRLGVDQTTRDGMYDALNQVVIDSAAEELTPRDERAPSSEDLEPQPAPFDVAGVDLPQYEVGDIVQTPDGEGTVSDAVAGEIPGEQTLQLTLVDGNEVVFGNGEVAPPIPQDTLEAFPELTDQILTEQDIVGAPAAAEPIEEVSAAPIVAPGDRWQGDRGAMPGEPFLFLDGDAETGTAAIREIADDQGNVLYEAATEEGQPLGQFPTVDEAAAAAEAAIPEKPPSDLPASQLTEDMQINDETLGMVEDRIVTDRGVTRELRAIIEERGRDTFQDWLNPAKVGARLIGRFQREGMSREDAKAQADAIMPGYTEKYDAVLAEDKPPAEVAAEVPATARILGLGPTEFDQELNQLSGTQVNELGDYLAVRDPGMSVQDTMFAIQDYYDEAGERAPREEAIEAPEEEIIEEAPPAAPEPEVTAPPTTGLTEDEREEREGLRERLDEIIAHTRKDRKARKMTIGKDTFDIKDEVDRIHTRMNVLDMTDRGTGSSFVDRGGNIYTVKENPTGVWGIYSSKAIEEEGELVDPRNMGADVMAWTRFGEAQQFLNKWAMREGVGVYTPEVMEKELYKTVDAYQPILDPKEQSTAHAKNVARILKGQNIQKDVMRGDDSYYKIKNDPYMDLVIERHLSPDGRNMALYLTHYFEQGGDLVMDTEMVYTIKSNGKLELRETAVRGPAGEHRQGPEYSKGADRSFATMFAKNLVEQGFAEGTLVDPRAERAAAEEEAPPAEEYPIAGETVDGRTVLEDVPNMDSIAATLDEYEILGVREVPLADFESTPESLFYAADDLKKARELAETLRATNAIYPLIVVVESEGPYILEGAHRLAALDILGAESFPALVVRDLTPKAEAAPAAEPVVEEAEPAEEVPEVTEPTLANWGLEVNPGTTKAGAPTFEVTGETKLYKDTIKAVPGRKWWNGKKTAWVFTEDPTAELVNLLQAEAPPAEAAPAAEAVAEEAPPADQAPRVEDLEQLEDRLLKFGAARLTNPLSGNPIDYKILEKDIRGQTVYVYTKTQDGVRVTKGGAVPGWAQDKAIGEAVRDAEFELGLAPGQQPAAVAEEVPPAGPEGLLPLTDRKLMTEKQERALAEFLFENRTALLDNKFPNSVYWPDQRQLQIKTAADDAQLTFQVSGDGTFLLWGSRSPESGTTALGSVMSKVHTKSAVKAILADVAAAPAEEREPARMVAIGLVSGGKVSQIEERGYEIEYGDLKKGSELYWDLVGLITGGKADKFLDAGITIRKPEGLEVLGEATATDLVANNVKIALGENRAFKTKDLFAWADEAYGGTQAEGKYVAKDAYDAMELGVNQFILENPDRYNVRDDASTAKLVAQGLTDRINKLLPTQTRRTEESQEFQQFSTPPQLAYVANWVANVQEGEQYLEPSAGIGGLAVFGKNAGARVWVNELSPRRNELLALLRFDTATAENAEQIANIAKTAPHLKDLKPTVVVMNPPFSATAGRIPGRRRTTEGAKHIEQALQLLEPGGRLVAIVGKGMAEGKSAFVPWWAKIRKKYVVRANVRVSGKGYRKYGTTFDNQVIVIDKIDPIVYTTITGKVDSPVELIDLLEGIRDERTTPPQPSEGIEPVAGEPTGAEVIEPGERGTGARPDVGAPTGELGVGEGVSEPEAGGERLPAQPTVRGAGVGERDIGVGEPTPGERAGAADEGVIGEGARPLAGERGRLPESKSDTGQHSLADVTGDDLLNLFDQATQASKTTHRQIVPSERDSRPQTQDQYSDPAVTEHSEPEQPAQGYPDPPFRLFGEEVDAYEDVILTAREVREKEITAEQAIKETEITQKNPWIAIDADVVINGEPHTAGEFIEGERSTYTTRAGEQATAWIGAAQEFEDADGNILELLPHEVWQLRQPVEIDGEQLPLTPVDQAEEKRPDPKARLKEATGYVKEIAAGAAKINDILGDSGAFDSGDIDQAKWEQIRPILTDMWNAAANAGKSANQFVQEVAQLLGERARAYFQKWVVEEFPKLQGEVTEAERDVGELTDAIFDEYAPQNEWPGAQEHPSPLVESAALAATKLPPLTYKLSGKVLKTAKVSSTQLESAAYTGQAHEEVNSDGSRRGFFNGDGTGLGKGREIVAVMWDNWIKGREKAVWISETPNLAKDALRDMTLTGWKQGGKKLFTLGKAKATAKVPASGTGLGDKITQKNGILFTSYRTLASNFRDIREDQPQTFENMNIRINQIVEWLGPDFDGVVAFDESHNMSNAIDRGSGLTRKAPSQQALAGLLLQRRLPNARVMYVSATGATEIENMVYASRLGLWGEGTAFANQEEFLNQMGAGGLGAMEQVARDMKAMGLYLSRSLSYANVKYDRLTHELTDNQGAMYDKFAEAWQIILANLREALNVTDASARARMTANSQFWGNQQRFFNQVIISMQMPSVLTKIEKDLEAGNSVVLQLTSTGEAQTNRVLARRERGQDIEELDFTPREMMMTYLERAFPTQQYEEFEDEEGNVQLRPVYDAEGNPVENAEAVEMRDNMLAELGSIQGIENPLDILVGHFGTDNLAEVTGRAQRRVYDPKKRKQVMERWGDRKANADAEAFMDGKKFMLVFSEKGGTGRSYHADLDAKNQRKRIHYVLQPGWRADRAIQGMGRSHRSNQAVDPEFILVQTNLKGQKRFLSTIARRLDQLGALTKGQRQAGSQGIFQARDNLETRYAFNAVNNLMNQIARGQVDGVPAEEFENKTSIQIRDRRTGQPIQTNVAVKSFLNKLLGLEVGYGNRVFDAFSELHDQQIQAAQDDGSLDVGIETIFGDKVEKLNEEKVYTDPRTGAETHYVQVDVTNPASLMDFDKARGFFYAGRHGYFKNVRSGRVWIASKQRERTTRDGDVVSYHTLISPATQQKINTDVLESDRWEQVNQKDARQLWDEEHEQLPKTITTRVDMLRGTLLPIWNRIPSDFTTIYRLQTDEGERILGRLIPPAHVAQTLDNLGATADEIEIPGNEIVSMVMNNNSRVRLNNRWIVRRSKVSGENRLEIVGPGFHDRDALENYGLFQEVIDWKTRFFIPVGPQAGEIIETMLERQNIEITAVETPQGERLVADEGEDTGGTTLYSGFGALQEITNLPAAVRDRFAKIGQGRIAQWWAFLQGRQHEDVRVVLKKDFGPQVGWWFRNMDSILSQTRHGRKIYEAGREYKQDTVKQFKAWNVAYDKAVEGLTNQEKREVLNLVDTVEDPTGQGKVVEAAQAVRELTRDVRQYLIDNGHMVGFIEGYLPHMFNGHFWVNAKGASSQKVESLAEALQIAEQMAEETGGKVSVMQDTFIPPDDAQMMNQKAYWRLVKALSDNLGEAIPVLEDLDTREVHRMISGAKVARPLPRKRFFGNMRQRLVNNPNFIKDLDEVMRMYFYGASRKVHQDILMRKVQSTVESMPANQGDLRKFVGDHFMPGVLAHPTTTEKAIARAVHTTKIYPGATGQDIRKWMHNVNLIQYVMDLGLSMSSAIANSSQFFMNVWPIVGEKASYMAYKRAASITTKMMLAPGTLNEQQRADLQEITEMGITSAVSSITGEIIIEEGTVKEMAKKLAFFEGLKGFGEATLIPFSTVELQNRFASYFAGKFWAQQQLAKGKTAVSVAKEISPQTSTLAEVAMEIDERLANTKTTRNVHWQRKQDRLVDKFQRLAGVEINDKTQFRVGRENLPFILREAPIRLFSPYKTFLMNQLKYTIDTLSPKGIRTNPKKALRFAGITLAAAGVAGNPIVYGVFLMINKVLKHLFDYDLEEEIRRRNLRRGLTGWLGIDISGAVAVWLPDRASDLLGRFGKIALELGQLAFQDEIGAGPLGITEMRSRRLKRQFLPAQLQRTLDALTILDEGVYVTPLTKTPVALEQEPWIAATKRFIGMLPKSVSRTFEEEQVIQRRKREFKSLSRDLTERWAQAVKENDQAAMDDVVGFVVKKVNKSLERLKKASASGNESATIKALTEIVFYQSWINGQQKFRSALEKKYIPRQLEKTRRMPKYMKPEAMAGATAAMPSTRSTAPEVPAVDRDTKMAEFRKAYIRSPNLSARTRVKKKVANWNSRQRRNGKKQLIIPWAEVARSREVGTATKPPPPSSPRPKKGGGLLRYRPNL